MLTRRDMMLGLTTCIGVQPFTRNDKIAALYAQVNAPAHDYESGAKACAALLALLGMDESFDYGSTRDACRAIMAADQLLCGRNMAHDNLSIWESYSHENVLISKQRLAELVPQEAEEEWRSTGWDASRIQRVLELADYLLAEEFIRQEDERIVHDLPF